MKKVLFAVLLLASTAASAQCYTQTYIIGGQIVTCVVCPQITTCN